MRRNDGCLSACVSPCLHLLAAVDEALLHRRDALLLLDLFLDLRDLAAASASPGLFARGMRYLVVHLDVELNLLARQCSHPARSGG